MKRLPRAEGKTPGGSTHLVIGPQAGPYSMQSRGGTGAVRAPMCPLTPCRTPTPHVPRGGRPVEARPLSLALMLGHTPSSRGGEWVQYGPPCALQPHAGLQRLTCQGEDAPLERAPCHWPPSGAILHPFRGGYGCSTGPHVPFNPIHDPIAPMPRGGRPVGACPLSFAPKRGRIQSNLGGEWVQYRPPCAL